MTVTENDTRAYHRGPRASLGWEQTISESLRDPASPYMEALSVRRTYGDTISGMLLDRGMIRDGFRILEVGGGYGNLAREILPRFPNVTMTMVDISPVFSERQKETLSPFGSRVAFQIADCFDYLEHCDRFDLIISNENMADFPSLVDIPKERLIDYMRKTPGPDPPSAVERDYLERTREFFDLLDLSLDDAPDIINLNTGAVRFVDMAMKKTDRLFVTEHSSDWSTPESMAGVFRDHRTDLWPTKVILFSHNEVTICFDHLKRLLAKRGLCWEGGRLMELLLVRDDQEIRYILLSGSIQTYRHEIIGEFIDHVKEYQWLLVHR